MISSEKAEAIRELADADGYIEPAEVVEAARKPTHPLHGDFPWDDRNAAHAHRLDIARRLIRLVKIEFTYKNHVISAVGYVSDPERPPKSRRYIDLTVAASNRDLSQQILLDEMERITAAIRRAKQVAAVLGLSDQLDALLADVNRVVQAAEIQAQQRRAKKQPKRAATRKKRRAPAEARV